MGRVTGIGRSLDPVTRKVDVIVAPPDGTTLLVGSYIRGEIAPTGEVGLVIPSVALVSTDDGWVVFVAAGGKAHAVPVSVLVRSEGRAQVEGSGLAAGDDVVVVGQYTLSDGLVVHTKVGAP